MFSFLTKRWKNPNHAPKSSRDNVQRRRSIERLEDRAMMTTYSVTTLNDSGAGSLRQAILDANAHAGADKIEFDIAGTIGLTSGALPTITGEVNIDGTTAPSYAGDPLVAVDFNNFSGLKFTSGASGSALRSLDLIDSRNNGVTLDGVRDMLIVGNFIGLEMDGETFASNRGNGIELTNSHDNTIGGPGVDDCNVISGNNKSGIRLNNSRRNDILGNCIGVNAEGDEARGNGGSGIVVTDRSYKTVIGGEAGNIISGNFANGVLINGNTKLNTVASNFIGTDMFGQTSIANHGDGVKLQTTERNLIGREDIVTGINYFNSASGTAISTDIEGWQGIRGASVSGNYLIVGTSGASGVLFDGAINGNGGQTTFPINVPFSGVTETTVYGPDLTQGGTLRLVGTYQSSANPSVLVNGFLFQGTTTDLGDASHYRTINYPGAQYTYVHSIAGNLAVGNYTSEDDEGHKQPGKAFIYDIVNDKFLPDVEFPGSEQNSAYGIWWNGGTKYTIAGGYSNGLTTVADGQPLDRAYLVDFNTATQKFSHWKSYDHPGKNVLTHFQGISSVQAGYYALSANSVIKDSEDPAPGSWVLVYRKSDGSFSDAEWVDLDYNNEGGITTGDSVYGNQVVGIVIGEQISYQATIDVGFQLSNIISGNNGNGIGIYGATDNHIAMNNIGVDVTGTLGLGNIGNGILITDGASGNMIGGVASGGNDPTEAVFVRPPQGNLISANDENGVLITGGATDNQLSGNFIGTDNTGNAPLGNNLDGVAIVEADGNSLIGCDFFQNPFVYYNVISGNLGNGLRIKNSDNTIIQANFFGLGADNNTGVGNFLNGMLIEGNSAHTTMGGPIPLGNVTAANGQNGVYIRNTASDLISYNTFSGIAAFSANTTLGNGQDGFKITSTGGDIYIRTCVISCNLDDGIDISGNATGVRVDGVIIGLNYNGVSAQGNADNGIEIRGNAHNNLIGTPQPSFNLIPQNTISANGGNGIAILENAHSIVVNHSYIGLDVFGLVAYGNANAGVYIGSGTFANTIGAVDLAIKTVISGNLGNGIEMNGTRDNVVCGTYIGSDREGIRHVGNQSNGILIIDSSHNLIGSKTKQNPGNVIVFNEANGVHVRSGDSNTIRRNAIYDNALLGISLSEGANDDQAAPVLTDAHLISVTPPPSTDSLHPLTPPEGTPVGLTVTGVLTSTANTNFILEFYANFTDGPSGRYLLGSLKVKTGADGVADFEFIGKVPPIGAGYITSTATDSDGNTSEFSNSVAITDWPAFTPGIYLLPPIR
jgi:trimeric autotransporter adhesin